MVIERFAGYNSLDLLGAAESWQGRAQGIFYSGDPSISLPLHTVTEVKMAESHLYPWDFLQPPPCRADDPQHSKSGILCSPTKLDE